MKRFLLIVAILFAGWLTAAEMTAEQFLEAVRAPLRREAWGEITGLITCKREGQEMLEGTMRLKVSFSETGMLSQITLNEVNEYLLEQNLTDGNFAIEVEMPEKEQEPGLFAFGISPADLSFAFIYWPLVEELPEQSSRWRKCRVMKLKNPDGTGYVNVMFNAEHGFPMEAEWYRNGEEKPWRRLIMKGAKRHANGLWFVREMRLEGDDWKTSIRFDFASMKAVGE